MHGRAERLLLAIFLGAVVWASMFSLNWYTLVLARVRDSFQYPLLAALVATPALIVANRFWGRGGASVAGGLYMAYFGTASFLLTHFGYTQPPFPPLILAPAIAIDVLAEARPLDGWRPALLAGLLFAPAFYAAEAASLAWLPHVALPTQPKSEITATYVAAALARPWDLAHVLQGLPFAMAAGALGGAVGGWIARAGLSAIPPGAHSRPDREAHLSAQIGE